MIRLGCRIILHVFSLNKKQNIVKIYNFYYQKRSELSFLLVCFFLALKKRFNTNNTFKVEMEEHWENVLNDSLIYIK